MLLLLTVVTARLLASLYVKFLRSSVNMKKYEAYNMYMYKDVGVVIAFKIRIGNISIIRINFCGRLRATTVVSK